MPTTELATLPDWLEVHRRERPDAVAISGDGADVSYAELADDVARLAAGLAASGIGKDDVVAAQLPNGRAFVTAFLATAALGAVFQTLHMPYRSKELRYLIGHAGAKAVFAVAAAGGASPASDILALKAELPALEHVVGVGGTVDGTLSYAALLRSEPIGSTSAAGPDDTYLLLYTSGTTAEPKGVPHSARAFLGNAFRSVAELGIGPDSRVLSVAALSHLYGLFTVHLALAAGATITLLPVFQPASFAQDLEGLAPTHVFAAPAHFSPLIAESALTEAHLRSVAVLCLSGTTVPPTLAAAVDALLGDGAVIQLWGMSELQAGTFGRPQDPLETRTGTAGRVSPRTELRIVAETGETAPAGVEGELEVRGPSVFAGYLNNPAETERAFTPDGWFRTGDLARLDQAGYLTLTGRTKELINRGGVKYNPVEVELIAITHPAILHCAVVAYPDAVLGERACLCVEARPDQAITLDDIRTLLEARGVAKYKWPERLEILPNLPMTPTRKVMRGALAAMLITPKTQQG